MLPQVIELRMRNSSSSLHPLQPLLPAIVLIGVSLPDLRKVWVIEKDIPQIETARRFIREGIQTARLLEYALFAFLMMKDIEEFQEHHPGQLLIVKSMSPDCFVHPHGRGL